MITYKLSVRKWFSYVGCFCALPQIIFLIDQIVPTIIKVTRSRLTCTLGWVDYGVFYCWPTILGHSVSHTVSLVNCSSEVSRKRVNSQHDANVCGQFGLYICSSDSDYLYWKISKAYLIQTVKPRLATAQSFSDHDMLNFMTKL